MTVEACPDIEAAVERLKARADAWSLNEDGARLGVRLGDLRAILSERKALREALGKIAIIGSPGDRQLARQALKGDTDAGR